LDRIEGGRMFYSFPYILLVLFYGILAFIYDTQDEHSRYRLKMLCMVVFLIFFGLRGFIGDDWQNYYPFYMYALTDSVQNIVYTISDSEFEPGYMTFMILSKILVPNYHFFIFLCCAINGLLLYRFLNKRVDNFPLAMMFFVCMGGFGLQVNLIRNSIALLLFLNSLDFITERKPIPYFSMCLLAMTIHVSAIVYIPLYFVFHKRLPRWVFMVIFILGNLVFLLHIKFIGPILIAILSRMGEAYADVAEVYIEGKHGEQQIALSVGFVERFLTGLLVICYYNKLVELRKENVLFINSFIGYFFMFFFFSEFDVLGRRLALLFVFSYWILWGDLLKCFVYEGNRKLFMAFLFVYCVLKIRGMTNHITLEYDNVLWGTKSYEERLYIHKKNDPEDGFQ